MATYNNLYLDTRKRLKAAGVEMAQLEAQEAGVLRGGQDAGAVASGT